MRNVDPRSQDELWNRDSQAQVLPKAPRTTAPEVAAYQGNSLGYPLYATEQELTPSQALVFGEAVSRASIGRHRNTNIGAEITTNTLFWEIPIIIIE